MYKDYSGQVYGRITVLRRAPSFGEGKWWCRCKCGKEFATSISAVRRGTTVSCGCYRANRARQMCDVIQRKVVPIDLYYSDGRVESYESTSQAARMSGIDRTRLFTHTDKEPIQLDGVTVRVVKHK